MLVTTLTKRMAEDLTDYLAEHGVRVRYLHSDIDTVERMEIIRDLRLGEFDVLVGINLLREGLDLPEVSLVAILDADKEGFLRSEGFADPDHRSRRAQRQRHGSSCMPTGRPARWPAPWPRWIDAARARSVQCLEHGIEPADDPEGSARCDGGGPQRRPWARPGPSGRRGPARYAGQPLAPEQALQRIRQAGTEDVPACPGP